MSIDTSIQPPSYAVRIDSSSSIRYTSFTANVMRSALSSVGVWNDASSNRMHLKQTKCLICVQGDRGQQVAAHG